MTEDHAYWALHHAHTQRAYERQSLASTRAWDISHVVYGIHSPCREIRASRLACEALCLQVVLRLNCHESAEVHDLALQD